MKIFDVLIMTFKVKINCDLIYELQLKKIDILCGRASVICLFTLFNALYISCAVTPGETVI